MALICTRASIFNCTVLSPSRLDPRCHSFWAHCPPTSSRRWPQSLALVPSPPHRSAVPLVLQAGRSGRWSRTPSCPYQFPLGLASRDWRRAPEGWVSCCAPFRPFQERWKAACVLDGVLTRGVCCACPCLAAGRAHLKLALCVLSSVTHLII